MAWPNTNYSDIIATTLEHRAPKIADNMSNNTALLSRLLAKGKIRTVPGGTKIVQPISYAENGNFMYYSGAEQLQVPPADVITAAEFAWKQAAVPVMINGHEADVQNTGKEALIDLMESRIAVAEQTIINNVSVGLYSDVTGSGGKQITGLGAAVPITVTNTYGGIDRNVWTFWRPIYQAAGYSSSTILAGMDLLWPQLVAGTIKPDLYPCDAGAQAILLLSHLGLKEDREIAAELQGEVPLILGGHSHNLLPDGERVGDVWIAQAGQYAEHLGRVELEWDGRRLLPLAASVIPVVESIPPSAEVQSLADQIEREVQERLDEVICQLPAPLDYAVDRECGIGNLLSRCPADPCPGGCGCGSSGRAVFWRPVCRTATA